MVLVGELKGPVIPIEDSTPISAIKFTPVRLEQRLAPIDTKWQILESNAREKVTIENRRTTSAGMPLRKDDTTADVCEEIPEPKMITITKPERWVARLTDGRYDQMSKEDVIALFGKKFTTEVEVNGVLSHGSFVNVPVGSIRQPRLQDTPSLSRENAPVVQFQQGMYDTCMYSSMASALFYAGLRDTAAQVHRAAVKDCGGNPRILLHKLKSRIQQRGASKYASVTSMVASIGRLTWRKICSILEPYTALTEIHSIR